MSQIKYLYISDTAESEPPVQNGEGIMVIDAEGAYYITALISNELYNSDIYAPEINWYLRYTQEQSEAKKEIFKALYEIRYIRHKNSFVKKHSLDVQRSVAIIGEGEEADAFVEYAERFFEVTYISPSKLLKVEGELGAFRVSFEAFNEEEEKEEQQELSIAQIIFCDANNELTKKMGVESLEGNDTEELVKRFRNRIGWYEYAESLKFEPTKCLFMHQDEPTCKSCLDVCPTHGLSYDEEKKEIYFSHLDCIDCGVCVSVCPHEALDFAYFTKEAFLEVAKLSKGKKVLLIAEKYLKEVLDFELPAGFLPLVVETDSFLTQFHFESLLQETESCVLLYAPKVTAVSVQAIEILNQTRGERIFVAKNQEELEASFKLMDTKG